MRFWIPLIVPIVPVVLMAGIMYVTFSIWRRQIGKRNRRSPLTRKMLRTPGESLRNQIDDVQLETDFVVMLCYFGPFVLYSAQISQLYFVSNQFNWLSHVVVPVIAGAILLGIGFRKAIQNLERIRRLRLGMEGELATGEELNQLMLSGCRVFHDVPCDYGNIDHVVISTGGVFAIETKTIGKLNSEGSQKVTVNYTTNQLEFSDKNVWIPVKQMETVSSWLEKYLSSSTAMEIRVEAMPALPGYYIDKRVGQKTTVFVFNPVNPQRLFSTSRAILTPVQVQQIAHQVEQLCRDVEPSFGYRSTMKKNKGTA